MCITNDNPEMFKVARDHLAKKTVGTETYGECRRNFRAENECEVGGGKNVMCQMQWPDLANNAACCAGLRKGLGNCGPYDPSTRDGARECSYNMRGYCYKPEAWAKGEKACPRYCKTLMDIDDDTDPDYAFCAKQLAKYKGVKAPPGAPPRPAWKDEQQNMNQPYRPPPLAPPPPRPPRPDGGGTRDWVWVLWLVL